jgi:hypothetical protein
MKDAVDCGFIEQRLREAKSRGVKCWDLIDDPDDKRKVLMGYEALNDARKRMVWDRFGNPYEHVIRQPILEMVQNDPIAHLHYNTKMIGAERLDVTTVNKYTRAASWLNMLRDLDKQVVKKVMNVSVEDFYIHAGELISLEKAHSKNKAYAGLDVLPGDFPSSKQRLMAKVQVYRSGGYDSVIDARFDNKNAAKIGKVMPAGLAAHKVVLPKKLSIAAPQMPENMGLMVPNSENKAGGFDPELKEKQMAVIRACARLANNLSPAQVTKMVNVIFQQNGWETVSRYTIGAIMKENEHVLTPGRRGKRTYMNEVAMQNKRKAPQWPMLYVTLDGWTAELMYREYSKKKGWEYKRLVVVVVLDPCGKYPLGYAIGERETAELIREGCRNAILHTKELFGEVYQPLQVQSDNYASKALTPFYQAMAAKYYTPAEVGNAKAKVIEPYFMYLNKQYCQTQYSNWSGFNIDASKENQVNREYLDKIKDQFPDKAGVEKQIHAIITQDRELKVADYVAKWREAPEDTKVKVDVANYLMMFGEVLGDRTVQITGQGLVKQIDGVAYTYDSFDPGFRANMHMDWLVMGDKHNLGHVLAVSPDGKTRFVLEQKRELPMDLYSTTQEDVDSRMEVKHFNKDRMHEIAEQSGRDMDITREVIRNTPLALTDGQEGMLKLMPTIKGQQKENIQDAKRLGKAKKAIAIQEAKAERYEAKRRDDEQLAFLTEGIDFSPYNNI